MNIAMQITPLTIFFAVVALVAITLLNYAPITEKEVSKDVSEKDVGVNPFALEN